MARWWICINWSHVSEWVPTYFTCPAWKQKMEKQRRRKINDLMALAPTSNAFHHISLPFTGPLLTTYLYRRTKTANRSSFSHPTIPHPYQRSIWDGPSRYLPRFPQRLYTLLCESIYGSLWVRVSMDDGVIGLYEYISCHFRLLSDLFFFWNSWSCRYIFYSILILLLYPILHSSLSTISSLSASGIPI